MPTDYVARSKAVFDAAHMYQQPAARKVAEINKELSEITRSIRGKRSEIVAEQRRHDHKNELYERYSSQEQEGRANKKLLQRNSHGEQAKLLREQLRDLEAQEQAILKRLDAAKAELRLVRAQCDYHVARHHYLADIAIYTRHNHEARMHKLRIMQEAGIPPIYSPEQVWHYEYINGGEVIIHFFFGGGISPPGDGNSPDGEGHGHYILARGSTPSHLLLHRDPVN